MKTPSAKKHDHSHNDYHDYDKWNPLPPTPSPLPVHVEPPPVCNNAKVSDNGWVLIALLGLTLMLLCAVGINLGSNIHHNNLQTISQKNQIRELSFDLQNLYNRVGLLETKMENLSSLSSPVTTITTVTNVVVKPVTYVTNEVYEVYRIIWVEDTNASCVLWGYIHDKPMQRQ